MAVQDILLGPGRLYRAPVGEANPDETTIAYGAAWGGNWTDMGDLVEGQSVTLTWNEDIVKVYGEQSTSVKKQSRTRREPMISGTLLEHTVDVMALVTDDAATTTAAGASQKGYSEFNFGVNTDVDEYKWGIEALRKDTAGNSQPVRWFFHKGTISFPGGWSYAKTSETGIPFEIAILEDDSQAAGEELGILQIVTAPST